jgi:hypothetical protein
VIQKVKVKNDRGSPHPSGANNPCNTATWRPPDVFQDA